MKLHIVRNIIYLIVGLISMLLVANVVLTYYNNEIIKGAHLWGQYLQLEDHMMKYVNRIDAEAQQKYEEALLRNQIIQVILLIVCVPTLLLTAFYTTKAFKLSELVRNAEEEKNKMLSEQNLMLEKKVAERTQEILAQNEEIISQNEELLTHQDTLSLQNKQLQEAQQTIKEQSAKIHSLNDHLKNEVDNRTQELQRTNQELIEHNNQLEQFAFIAAHNLRAPLTRVLGLANLIQMGETEQDKQTALEKLISSTHDLDQVIKDLNAILTIKRHTGNFTEVDLNESLTRTKRILEKEIEDTHTKIIINFSEADKVYAIAPYVESILYNLISNAIKYRDPERAPFIAIKTTHEKEFVCLAVMDNGLGIDLSKYKQSVFSLYKRFHLHVEGKGLGLYLVKTQIEALGGRVDVKSEPNEGTTFQVYFKRYLI